ncbi:uncharacterized protein SPPG_02518 [Spizellomyces punctatus DAOM BR117]|uniref:FAD dependent oxidoreductase domain-containing protein n=1 Tax=Spizellomyces punctatus (strain DAOM BR117) TaxID=645134 RepID=A0A0L0HMG5_SPIPD|nr:uncharacterized protein SPPG_02518 [Spizellomyces punctatus DAOM BR117]KND02014.1 hypothetical protein SPPG_02518 [Spizellomyces punctatus DAOM BR117]|eukprot:XP_016610053.1 hypothetical protein SPPG_02518 [Spizellomyces punctatus DAOM BR117]
MPSKRAAKVTVLGGGVIGLTVAGVLQARGYKVTVVSRAFPDNPDDDPSFTSPAAGAHWRSFAEKDDYRLQEWDETTFQAMVRLCDVPGTGLMMAPAYEFWADPMESWEDPFFARFTPKYKILDTASLPPTCKFGISYETICINVPKYLLWLLEKFKSLGGSLRKQSVAHIDELLNEDVDVVINCAGIGARTLGGVEDVQTYATRGQTVLVRAPHVRHTVTRLGQVHEDFTYIIPRDDGIVVLGGTYQANNYTLEPDMPTAEAIIQRCLSICPELQVDGKLDIIKHKAGLRPTRVGGVRCEAEWKESSDNRKVLLVHCYGHGGYGFQSSIGCAATVAMITDGERARRGAHGDELTVKL